MAYTQTVTLMGIKKIRNSPNGNPTWELATSAGFFRTGTDSNVGHQISDYYVGKEVILTFDTKATKVIGLDLA